MKRTGIQICPDDAVVTLVDSASPGDLVEYMVAGARREIAVIDEIPFGHKVAVRSLGVGDMVLKYNESIGRASKSIAPGEHVHVHNVESSVQGGTQ